MMTASAMSAMIRAKKKKMEEDHSDAVKLSGIPMDATDIDIIKNQEEGEKLSENIPMDSSEDNEDKIKKQAKIKLMMMKMGK